SSAVAWSDTPNNTYIIRVRAHDKAGNYQTNIASFTITYDQTAPTIALTSPDPTSPTWLSSLSTIVGNASHNYGLRTSTSIEIRIFDQIGSVYLTTGTNNWTPYSNVSSPWTINSPAWTFNHSYRIEARAYDQSGTISPAYSTATFTYDPYQASPELPDSGLIY